MTKARLSESNLLSEESDELSIVEHPVVVLVHHGDVLFSLGHADSHPPVLREDLGELLSADTTAEH